MGSAGGCSTRGMRISTAPIWVVFCCWHGSRGLGQSQSRVIPSRRRHDELRGESSMYKRRYMYTHTNKGEEERRNSSAALSSTSLSRTNWASDGSHHPFVDARNRPNYLPTSESRMVMGVYLWSWGILMSSVYYCQIQLFFDSCAL